MELQPEQLIRLQANTLAQIVWNGADDVDGRVRHRPEYRRIDRLLEFAEVAQHQQVRGIACALIAEDRSVLQVQNGVSRPPCNTESRLRNTISSCKPA